MQQENRSSIKGLVRRTSCRLVAPALTAATALSALIGVASAPSFASVKASSLTAAQTKQLAQIVTGDEGAVTWKAPGPAFSIASLKGKKIFALIDQQSVPFQTTLADGVKAAAAAAGINVTVADGNSQTSQDIQLLENAVHQKYSAIVLGEDVPSTVAPALREAKAAKIPVVSLLYGDPRAVLTPQNKALSVVADSTYCYTCSGAIAADEAIYKTGGKVNAVVITAAGEVLSTDIQNGFEEQLAKYCPKTCTSKIDTVNLSDIAQAVTTAAQVGAQNPAVNTMFAGVDFMVSYITPVLKTAGATNRISVLSTNADLAPMQNMAAGGAVKGDVGNPVAWDSWGSVDQVLRLMKGLPPSPNENLPIRLFTPSNIKSINLNQSVSTWFGPTNYASSYTKLWGSK